MFSNTKICKNHEGSFNLGKTWSFRFASLFSKSVACNEAQKNKEFQEKTKKIQNHEGSCNLGKTFWNPKKLLISSMETKYQLLALLESGIGGLMMSVPHFLLKCWKTWKNNAFVGRYDLLNGSFLQHLPTKVLHLNFPLTFQLLQIFFSESQVQNLKKKKIIGRDVKNHIDLERAKNDY